MALQVSSAVFDAGGTIPEKYTCDGDDVSPPLAWGGVPGGTQSFALIVDDPDAPSGIFTHWVLFNLPAQATGLPEGVPAQATLDDGARQGTNSFRKPGYGGPCPPRGHGTHRYFFKLYALDAMLDLDAGATKEDLTGAMQGHVLAEGELMGRYARA
jgi:Raf kinase inhibitor-like YbhB/YbcL family protein